MSEAKKIVIVGGVACGPKAASRLKRIMPDAEITMIEKGDVISYGACGSTLRLTRSKCWPTA